MQIRTEEVETTLCDSLYSLKLQVQVLHQQLQFHSNVYAFRTEEVETLCDSLCIITNFLNYFIDVAANSKFPPPRNTVNITSKHFKRYVNMYMLVKFP